MSLADSLKATITFKVSRSGGGPINRARNCADYWYADKKPFKSPLEREFQREPNLPLSAS